MAQSVNTSGPASTLAAHSNTSEREDLANFISMITRDETPFMSSIGKTKANAIFHEWQTDELETPGSRAVSEGATFDTTNAAGITPNAKERDRLGNYTQINGKSIEVTGTKRAVDQAGVADEYAYQLKKRGTEMRRDMEFDLVQSFQSSNGSGTRTAGGVPAWVDASNVVASGNFLSDSEITAQFNGDGTLDFEDQARTKQTIALADIDEVMQNIYENGGKATKVMVSPKNRREISTQAQAASNVRRDIGDSGSLRQSVDIYMSDFGDLMVVPNYVMGFSHSIEVGTNDLEAQDLYALVYDPMWFNFATLRPMQETDVAQQGDSTRGQIIEEWTLECTNPKGFGIVYGIGA